jgi:N-acyl-D-amino-acid deacylase
LTRRQFIGAGAFALGALALPAGGLAEDRTQRQVSVAEAFDREIEKFMEIRKVPGGALAVVKDRRLVYARGYGWADRDNRIRARADSLFRIASVSKPITAVTVLRLVEAKRVALDARAFEMLQLPALLEPGRKHDPRLGKITIRQLLQHTGGWDRDKSFDPMFRSRIIARAAGEPGPATSPAIIRYMLGQPLDFDPGARFAYSNFGYCVLGRVIEKLTGQPYASFVQQDVLAPIGIKRMRIGASLIDGHAPGEVRYYAGNDAKASSVFPGTPEQVPWAYGGFSLEAMDAHGGWIASAVDLARFAAALDDSLHSPLLSPETFRIMCSPPPPPVSRQPDGSLSDSYYGCGWNVRPAGANGKANYWHIGSLPGTAALLVRRHDGLSWAVLFNQRSDHKRLPDTAIDGALHRAADAVTAWPAENLFSKW